jgi:DNA adenine methylase
MRSYPGGKAGSGVYQRIISEQPPHEKYIEPFLGAGAIMRRKLPARVNIGIDADADPVSRARAMVDAGTWFLGASPDLADGARVVLVVDDGVEWLRRYSWHGRELVYCDPPYLMETRSCARRLYRCELDAAAHVGLIDVISRLPCMVQISGYWSELYGDRLSSWRVVRYSAMTRGGRLAEECLWMNYPKPVELHDYRYLGRNFRDRERLKRLRTRWLARLGRMGELERGALLSAMSAAWPDRRE